MGIFSKVRELKIYHRSILLLEATRAKGVCRANLIELKADRDKKVIGTLTLCIVVLAMKLNLVLITKPQNLQISKPQNLHILLTKFSTKLVCF